MCKPCADVNIRAAREEIATGEEADCPICGHAVLIHVGIKCGICVGQGQSQRAPATSNADDEGNPS